MNWKVKIPTGSIKQLPEKDGESIEMKMRKVTTSNEPIDNVAPLIYTDKKDGILPEYDVRTDRFELAREAKDRVSATHAAIAKKAAEEMALQIAQQSKEGEKIPEA